jgi:hypothetical protein
MRKPGTAARQQNSWIVVGVVSFLDAKAASMNPSEAQNPRDNQKNRYNVIEQLRYNQNQDAGDQRDDRLKVCDAYGHFLIPYVGCVITLPPPPGCSRPRGKNELSTFMALTITEGL